VDKHMMRLSDTNSFYRSKGCRDLVAMGKLDELSQRELGTTWNTLHEAILKLIKTETDEDVMRFAQDALVLMGAPRSPGGTWEPAEVEDGPLRRQAGETGKKKVEATHSIHMVEGESVYRQFVPWRAALTKSLRENRTISGCKNMEFVSSRLNQTILNRVVGFRGFVPDEDGEPKDRLFFVVNSNTEKAEQVALDVEADVLWRFKLTKEEYRITGRVRTIRAHKGQRKYQEFQDIKKAEAEEAESLLHYRRIAWNSCAPAERAAFMYPDLVETISDRQVDDLIRLVLEKLTVHPLSHAIQNPSTVFVSLDKEGTGTVTFEEFTTALREGACFMGDEKRRLLWGYLDSEGEGEISYSIFDDYMTQMQVPVNFWVMYCEPFNVERTGYGDALGRNEIEYIDGVPTERFDGELNTWLYYLDEYTGEWDAVPRVEEDLEN